MKKISVIYATKTKHSKKLADAIADALHVQALNVLDNPVVEETDLLFIVGGIYGGESLPEMRDFISKLDIAHVKSAALVTTSVSDKKGQDSVRQLLSGQGISVEDEFRCYGGFLVFKLGHPNKADVQNAVSFAVRLSKKES